MDLHLIALACAGHVLIDLPVFGGPVLMLVAWILYVVRRERRQERVSSMPPA